MLDRSKKVQEAACSAFSTFGTEAEDLLGEFLPVILGTLRTAFGKYQVNKETLLLYEEFIFTL